MAGNGKNERYWNWLNYATDKIDSLTFSIAPGYAREPYTVLKTAPTLYYIKESLLGAGWEFVSCSYRTDATGSALFPDTGYYPNQTASYGQNNRTNPSLQTKFAVTGSDMWITQSATYFTDAYFIDNKIPVNEMHRLIYPCNHNTTSSIGGNQNHLISSSVGRSWILLKNTREELKQHPGGEDLYIVLDYASAVPSYSANTATSSIVTVDGAVNGQSKRSLFGHSVGITFFYGEPQNTVTSEFVRPYRSDELSFEKYSTFSTATYRRLCNSGNVLIAPNTPATININTVYNDEYGGSYTYITENGSPTFILGIDKIADSLSSSLPTTKYNVGNVFFMAYSTVARNSLNFIGTQPTDLFTIDRENDIEGPGGIAPWHNGTDFAWFNDCYYQPLAYFKINEDAGLKTESGLFSTIPVYFKDSNFDSQLNAVGVLSLTSTNATTTLDGTYLEYPLPLLDVSAGTKIRYAGRIADVKLGPAGGFNGSMGRTGLYYDRILLGGIWFPFNSDAPPDL
jgi:hypothetical protein